ncbi:hypothetical protein, partial [Thermosynechococcus sp.]|uniref:hypothetical protein n=1 Tax=Thermosynechococcus sp. TaxID=2814275 RepID=UPI00391C08F0
MRVLEQTDYRLRLRERPWAIWLMGGVFALPEKCRSAGEAADDRREELLNFSLLLNILDNDGKRCSTTG